jgi:outer membrane protein OmpA-like peptidoglycan-associated protein
MMKKNIYVPGLYCLFIVFLCATPLSAEESEKSTLDGLTKYLEDSYKKYEGKLNLNNLDLYPRALGRISASEQVVSKKPESEEARSAFSSCSLLTEAAVLQLYAENNKAQITSLQKQINSVLNQIKSANESINKLERGKASQLKADLDAEKLNAQKAREEAEAERLKAQKLREEAEKKFSELQSSLIQVTNDARGTIISMSDILFEINKANLTADLKTSLAKIAGILLVFKTSNIIVEGHTDNQGSKEYNQTLSEKRAENVMNFLVEQGVASSRLKSIGYGLTKPIADNDTKEGRQKNRRVDLIVQEKKKDKE